MTTTRKIVDFETSDVPLASYLKLNGCTMTAARSVKGRGVFVFEAVDKKFLDSWNADELGFKLFSNIMRQMVRTARDISAL